MATDADHQPGAVLDYVQLAYTPIDKNTDRRRVQRAREVLQRQEVYNSVNHGKSRSTVRFEFSQPVIVILPPAEYPGFDERVQIGFNCWSNNVSQSGMSVIVGRSLMPVSLAACNNPAFSTAKIVKSVKNLEIGIVDATKGIVWVNAEIVRTNPSSEDLLEIGLRFESKMKNDPLGAAAFTKWLHPFLTE